MNAIVKYKEGKGRILHDSNSLYHLKTVLEDSSSKTKVKANYLTNLNYEVINFYF
jgi:hypothetical protein